LEHRYKKHGSEFETTIQNLEQRSAKAEKEFAKLTKLLDERDKKYLKELEDEVLKKDEKIQLMELQKKNDDLASRLENDMPGGGDLGDLEAFNGNMLNSGYNDQALEPDSYNNPNFNEVQENRSNSLVAMEAHGQQEFTDD